MNEKKLLTIRETAKIFNIPECALRRWTKSGELPAIKSGSWMYIIRQPLNAA